MLHYIVTCDATKVAVQLLLHHSVKINSAVSADHHTINDVMVDGPFLTLH